MVIKIDKPLARLTKEKRERTQINKIRDERGEIMIDITEIQRITQEYYEKLYSTKFNNLEEMDQYLEKYKNLRLNQEDLENLNRLISNMEIKTSLKTYQKVKVQH